MRGQKISRCNFSSSFRRDLSNLSKYRVHKLGVIKMTEAQTKPRTFRIVVDVPEPDYAKFRAIAEEQDLSIAQLARRCIRREVAEATEQAATPVYRSRASRSLADLDG
jgi:hypothetical protein